MPTSSSPRTIGVVLFDGFELLDVFGPLEIFGQLPDHFQINLVGPSRGTIKSAQGPMAIAETAYIDALTPDIVLIPGGIGTRLLVEDTKFLSWLAAWASPAEIVASVCTGSGLLAAAGLLDGYKATSNKQSFAWACAQSDTTDWLAKARWVHDRSRWTSSGVAAGMDMTLALISHLHGEGVADRVSYAIEYDWHRYSGWDPFASKFGIDK